MKYILIIYTGGTIGMQKSRHSNALAAVDFKSLTSSIPQLKSSDINVEHISLKNVIDSSNMTIEYWVEIAQLIESNYNDFDGFVVLHGSDTMAYSASALSFMLEGLAKPVIFTGSQIPIGARRTDAKENLITSIEISANKDIQEVCVYFEDKLYRGNRTVKINSQQFEAFSSPNYPILAEVGVNIKYNSSYFLQSNSQKLKVNTSLTNDVCLIKLFPSVKKEVISSMINTSNYIVIESFGSGNASDQSWFLDELSNAVNEGKLIVNCSQCLAGNVKQGEYETSSKLEKIGVISAGDMTTEAAITKLMFLSGKDISLNDKKNLFKKNIRGEITE